MAKDAGEINVALDMNLFVADAESIAQSDFSSWDFTSDSVEDLGALELGWNTKDGVTLTFSRTSVNIEGQGSLDPLRILLTAAPKTIAFTLEQVDITTWSFATGGASSTAIGSNYLVVPNPASELDERALVMLATDGDEHVLVVYPRGSLQGDTAIPFTDGGATLMPVTFGVLTPGDQSEPYFMVSDIAEFAPVGS